MRLILVILLLKLHFSLQTISCKSQKNKSGNSGANAIYRYDCTNLSITWSLLNSKAFDRMYSSRQINLSKNKFYLESTIIKSYSFSKFDKLIYKLNLSSNRLDGVESDAFAYEDENKKYLEIHTLDLSNNNFKMLPYKALAGLNNLTNLYFGYNDLHVFDFEPDCDRDDYNTVFKVLKYLHLNNCNLTYLSLDFLKYLQRLSNLKYLNLNGNQLITFDKKFESFSPLFLSIQSNPLNCSCEILWLKSYLLNQQKLNNIIDNEINFQVLNTPDFYDSTTCLLDYFEYTTYRNKNDSTPITTISALNANSEKKLSFMSTSISKLEDKQFTCPIQIIKSFSNVSETELIFECHLSSYPIAHIWWLFEDKTINSDLNNHYKFEFINNTDLDANYFKYKSILTVNGVTQDDIGIYKCCASYNNVITKYKATTVTILTDFLDIPMSLMVNFKNIFAQRLNQTIFETVSANYNGFKFAVGVGKLVAESKNLSSVSVINAYIGTNKNVIITASIIAGSIIFLFIIIFAVMIVLRCFTTKKSGNNTPTKMPIYEDNDYYSKHYEEIQQLKLRQHDGFEYNDDTRYTNIYKLNKSLHENDNISRDDDAISSVSNNKENMLEQSNIDIEDDLNAYQDSIRINLRKPGQTKI